MTIMVIVFPALQLLQRWDSANIFPSGACRRLANPLTTYLSKSSKSIAHSHSHKHMHCWWSANCIHW